MNNVSKESIMMRFSPHKCILILGVLCNFFIGVSFSLSYDLINPGDWKPVIDTDKIYNKSGWTTYSILMDKMAKLKINETGVFSFAWKMDQYDSDSKLYFKYPNKQDVLYNMSEWNTEDYNVKYGDEVSWYLTNSVRDILIAFPSEKNQNEIFSTNNPPSVPNILSRYSEGYNASLYGFSAKSSDPDVDKIKYTFYWGDGNNSTSEYLGSGEVTTQNHSWKRAGFYNVIVVATDEHGANSSFSETSCAIKISWLVKVPQGLPLQPVIDNVFPNTTILLEGLKYEGPINLEKVSWINISSNLTQSYLYSEVINSKWTIGLEDVNNIILNKINITSGVNGIYLNNSSYCRLINNTINSETRGIHMLGGHNNVITDNTITIINNDLRPCTGLSLENTWDNIVTYNIILNNKINGTLYYIRNSTFNGNNLKIIIPQVHNCIIQYDPSKYNQIDGDECCCNLTQSNMNLTCSKCRYQSDTAEKKTYEDCNLPFNVVICA